MKPQYGKSISVSTATVEELEAIQRELAIKVGFDPTMTQVIAHLLTMRREMQKREAADRALEEEVRRS